jgi:hypothetical protein
MLSYILLTIVNIAICLIIGYFGAQRKIGFMLSFLIALLGTPLIGIVCVLLSDKKNDNDRFGDSEHRDKHFDIEQYRKG